MVQTPNHIINGQQAVRGLSAREQFSGLRCCKEGRDCYLEKTGTQNKHTDKYGQDKIRDHAFVSLQRFEALQRDLNDRDLRIKELTKQLADAHVARELDEILLKCAATERQELLKLRESSSTQTEHITQQANTIAELATKIGSLEGEIRGLKDSNARLGELLACSSEYKVLGRMSRPGEQEQPPADRQTNIRYLKGSGGVGKKDLVDEIRNVVGKRGLPSKFHWTYKYWDKLSTTGRIEQEDMLWTPERCIEIVKEFQNGNYSKDPDLAIEKLLFEVLSGLS